MDACEMKQLILAAEEKPKMKPVEAPEWGLATGLYVREISAADLDEYNTYLMTFFDASGQPKRPFPGMRTALLVKALCDANGHRVFADTELELLGSKNSAVIERLHAEAQAINGLDKTSEQAAKN